MPKIRVFTLITLLFLLNTGVKCVEKELTISVDPGKEDCFYQKATKGEAIDIEYQVIDGGHGDLDITFHLVDPTGRILVADFKKSENSHRATVKMDGDHKFCFDNTFSSYNAKTVFFELIIENENEDDWGSNEDIDFQGLPTDNVYDLKVQDIQEVISNVRNHLTKVRHIQEIIKSTEARDRNVVEENFFKVNTFSMIQILIMVAAGLIQVVMVRSLFDDKSKVHGLWKKFDSRR